MALERSAIIDHLTRAGWTLTRTDSDHCEIWQPPAGRTVRIEPAQGWSDADARTAARRIGEIDGTPWHDVLGVPAPFDPKSDPVLHANGRGQAHAEAFTAADEARQARHLKREHAIDPGQALLISAAETLTEAHAWLHYKFDRD